MNVVTLAEAKAHLEKLVRGLHAGETIVIVENDRRLAQLSVPRSPVAEVPEFGFWNGMLEIVSDDEDHLKDFQEHMP